MQPLLHTQEVQYELAGDARTVNRLDDIPCRQRLFLARTHKYETVDGSFTMPDRDLVGRGRRTGYGDSDRQQPDSLPRTQRGGS